MLPSLKVYLKTCSSILRELNKYGSPNAKNKTAATAVNIANGKSVHLGKIPGSVCWVKLEPKDIILYHNLNFIIR